MTMVPAAAARADLPALLTRVAEGEEITITRHGRAVAVLIGPAALRARRSSEVFTEASRIGELLAEAREIPLSEAPPLSSEAADLLVAEIRAERDGS